MTFNYSYEIPEEFIDDFNENEREYLVQKTNAAVQEAITEIRVKHTAKDIPNYLKEVFFNGGKHK